MSEKMSLNYEVQSDSELNIVIDESLYPLDAVYGACYIFIDRCYLFLHRPEDKKIGIRFRAKDTSSKESMEALVGEFSNELLNQVLRFKISEATAQIREYTMARAFVSSPAQTSIDALLAELDAEELEEDDLEISVPWEE